jgi:arabinofuranosyltransferase
MAASSLPHVVERRFGVVFAATLAVLLAIAWWHRFLQDDAFILFRYAANWAAGHGPVYNPGERVEGYSGFLFMALIAAGVRAGLDPGVVAQTIGLIAALGSMTGAFVLARGLGASRPLALLAMILLGANDSFSAWATGGLETSLQTGLVTWCLALAVGELAAAAPRASRLLIVSALAGLALLTRLDSALLIAPTLIVLATRRPTAIPALVLPAAAILAPWLIWKAGFYGGLLPNTFRSKIGTHASLARGLFYLYQFVSSYWLPGVLALMLWVRRDLLAAGGRAGRVMLATLALWLAYLVAIGGDFMEFRMLVPALPIASWLLAVTIAAVEARARLGALVTALVLAGSAQHAITYSFQPHPDQNESVRELSRHLDGPGEDWLGIGRALARDLGADSGVIIATTAAGAIPYASGLRTVDMLGLTDPWTTTNGDPYLGTPGHRRITTLDHLIERGVTLVISHPTEPPREAGPVCTTDLILPRYAAGAPRGLAFPPGMTAVEIPVNPGLRILAWYLTPNPRVDEAIRAKGWRRRDVADCGTNLPRRR